MSREANIAAASLVSLPAELKNEIFVNLSLPDLLTLAGLSRHLTACCEALIYRSPMLSTSVQLVRFCQTIVHREQLALFVCNLFVNVPYTPVLFKKHAELLIRAAPCLQNLRHLHITESPATLRIFAAIHFPRLATCHLLASSDMTAFLERHPALVSVEARGPVPVCREQWPVLSDSPSALPRLQIFTGTLAQAAIILASARAPSSMRLLWPTERNGLALTSATSGFQTHDLWNFVEDWRVATLAVPVTVRHFSSLVDLHFATNQDREYNIADQQLPIFCDALREALPSFTVLRRLGLWDRDFPNDSQAEDDAGCAVLESDYLLVHDFGVRCPTLTFMQTPRDIAWIKSRSFGWLTRTVLDELAVLHGSSSSESDALWTRPRVCRMSWLFSRYIRDYMEDSVASKTKLRTIVSAVGLAGFRALRERICRGEEIPHFTLTPAEGGASSKEWLDSDSDGEPDVELEKRLGEFALVFEPDDEAELWHTGRVSHPEAPQQILAGVPVYAPSAISARGGKFRFIPGAPGYVTPTELPDPKTVVALFKEAAVNAKKAGFDGIEFHGANGYLIHQFLDSSSNHRTDEYGGSVANRARFVLELIAAVQDVFGPDVAIKLSPCGGYNDMGMPLSETIATFGHLLTQIDALPTPLSYVCLALYNPYLDIELEGTMRGTTHDVLETYKGYFKSKPRRTKLFLNSGIQPDHSDQAETFVGDGDGEGDVAGIFFGLAWIAHPDLARRIQANKPIDNAVDLTKLYGAPGVDPNLGYNDYKAAV